MAFALVATVADKLGVDYQDGAEDSAARDDASSQVLTTTSARPSAALDEQVRSLDSIASEDMFSYDFVMNSDEHREWLAAAGSN